MFILTWGSIRASIPSSSAWVLTCDWDPNPADHSRGVYVRRLLLRLDGVTYELAYVGSNSEVHKPQLEREMEELQRRITDEYVACFKSKEVKVLDVDALRVKQK